CWRPCGRTTRSTIRGPSSPTTRRESKGTRRGGTSDEHFHMATCAHSFTPSMPCRDNTRRTTAIVDAPRISVNRSAASRSFFLRSSGLVWCGGKAGGGQRGRAGKVFGQFASETAEEGNDRIRLLVGEVGPKLDRGHNLHGRGQPLHRAVVEVRRRHGHVAQRR